MCKRLFVNVWFLKLCEDMQCCVFQLFVTPAHSCPSTRGSGSLQKVNWLYASLQGKSDELVLFRRGKT